MALPLRLDLERQLERAQTRGQPLTLRMELPLRQPLPAAPMCFGKSCRWLLLR